MGKMSWIAYLAENGKREELMEEVSAIASASGRTAAEIADGFIEAVKTIEKNKENIWQTATTMIVDSIT